ARMRRRRAARTRQAFRNVTALDTAEPFRVTVGVGPHELTADLPPDEGGADGGPSPHDLLLRALGTCVVMTVQWAGTKHHIPLRGVEVRMSQSHTLEGHLFRCSMTIDGALTDEQRTLLISAAEHWPVARTPTGGDGLE